MNKLILVKNHFYKGYLMVNRKKINGYEIVNLFICILYICFFIFYNSDLNVLLVLINLFIFTITAFIVLFKYILLFNYFTKECRFKIRLYALIYIIIMFLMVITEMIFCFGKIEINWIIQLIFISLSFIELIILFLSSYMFKNYFYSEYSADKEKQIIKERTAMINQSYIEKYGIYYLFSDKDMEKLKKCKKTIISISITIFLLLIFSFSNFDYSLNGYTIFRYVINGLITLFFIYSTLSFFINFKSLKANDKIKKSIIFSTIPLMIFFLFNLSLFIIEANTLFINEDSDSFEVLMHILPITELTFLSVFTTVPSYLISQLISIQNQYINEGKTS